MRRMLDKGVKENKGGQYGMICMMLGIGFGGSGSYFTVRGSRAAWTNLEAFEREECFCARLKGSNMMKHVLVFFSFFLFFFFICRKT